MHKVAAIILLAGVSAGALATSAIGPVAMRDVPQRPVGAQAVTRLAAAQAQPAARTSAIAASVSRWNSLRQSDNLPFSAYASFLLSHRGWPGEAGLRRSAERRLSAETASPAEIIRFFDTYPPLTASGHAQRALALLATGRRGDALEAARTAWGEGVMAQTDETRLLGAFSGDFTPDDHDRRIDVLLGNGDRQSAARAINWGSPARRPLFEARLAMQNRAADAASRVSALDREAASRDPGFVIDRAVWLRETGNSSGAREWLAQPRRLRGLPANPAKFMDSALAIARGAANDRQWTLAYNIASQVDDLFPSGTDVSTRSFAERDKYTDMTWLAGQAALRINRPADAAGMFDRYGRAAQSPQTRAKGFYWAGRTAAQAGRTDQANAWFEQAASSPDQFYGLLALERLGRTPSLPPPAAPATSAERQEFDRRPLVQAIRHLGAIGSRNDQGLFVRALAGQLETQREREIAAELGRSIGRLDMGVWTAREARTGGASFYSRAAFPEVTIPPAYRNHWATAHGIMRQESSFERSAVSSANARGMMQLIPGTAQIEARRVGVPYNLARLTEDPDYNILLGSAHVSRLMDQFGNNIILVAIAYNAGPGRVPQWIQRNGDPRLPSADVLEWIENIPFSETRNYVQRVVENAMIYDLMNPEGSRSQGRISYYLGRHALR